ncbi:MAG: heavy metal-responsive transcriptional regulator [Gammaproteobacteria bacterium]|nr:heavy metal-responsive transcriptional regulator [Gammaproteobacteria bacterium]
MQALTIGKVAERVGVGVETVRFYERKGLIKPPRRGESGYRQYSEDLVARLRFIQRAKTLGFSLKEIGELLDIRHDPTTTCRDIQRRAEVKLSDVEEKIKGLRRMSKVLTKLIAECAGDGPTSACPILEALDVEGEKG